MEWRERKGDGERGAPQRAKRRGRGGGKGGGGGGGEASEREVGLGERDCRREEIEWGGREGERKEGQRATDRARRSKSAARPARVA